MDTIERYLLAASAVLILLSAAACSGTSGSRASGTVLASPDPKLAAGQRTEAQNRGLQDQIAQIASTAKGRVGVAAVILETGENVSLIPQDHFPMQSVYKLPISMAVLKQVDLGKLNLDQQVKVAKSDFVGAGQHSPIRDRFPAGTELTIKELVQFAISDSDGTASDVLMKLAGGPQAVQAYLAELEIKEMIVLNTEKELGQDGQAQYRNWATPDAAVGLLRALYERRGLTESSQSLLIRLMAESTPGQKRLKGLLPAGTEVAHKTGTSGTKNGITAATNDIGIISLPNRKHLAIAVFVSDSPADEKTREGVIAQIARAVWVAWGK